VNNHSQSETDDDALGEDEDNDDMEHKDDKDKF